MSQLLLLPLFGFACPDLPRPCHSRCVPRARLPVWLLSLKVRTTVSNMQQVLKAYPEEGDGACWRKILTKTLRGNLQPVPRLKLKDCEARRIIKPDPNRKYPYVALSYVWESAPPEKYNYTNLPDDLPPVILDTMRAVVKLGFRYVWIDRYCIWQDDQTHKMSQVERMDQIYSDAELTIVAVGAKDPGYGLPGLTLSRTQHVPINKRIGERHLVGKFSHHWQLNEVSKSKWATRGWTFQETCENQEGWARQALGIPELVLGIARRTVFVWSSVLPHHPS
ncbi:hypothetical protein HYQ46_012905 [Verticillium longisporum]|nr:hypothetical protein HYQ46_012905 [Verticillium longisporum]